MEGGSESDLADKIGGLVGDLLDVPPLGREEHIVKAGLHSLFLVALCAELSRLICRRVELRTILRNPTPASLARALRAYGANAATVD